MPDNPTVVMLDHFMRTVVLDALHAAVTGGVYTFYALVVMGGLAVLWWGVRRLD